MLLLALLLVGVTPSIARADLAENQVMLLYNSQDAESAAIATRYLQLHPGVVSCNLNITYTFHHGTGIGTFDGAPPSCGITSKYITPCKFKELFIDGPSNFTMCLANNPQILAIATTRGIPAAITNTLAVDSFDDDDDGSPCNITGVGLPDELLQPAGGIYASFEATLSRLRLGSILHTDASIAFDRVENPYYPDNIPTVLPPIEAFEDFLADPLDCPPAIASLPDLLCPGEMFIVSRLDSHVSPIDYDGIGGFTNVDGVIGMLLRAANPTVNKYAVTALFDHDQSSLIKVRSQAAISALWNDRWCYLFDDTLNFIDGPNDPQPDGVDGAFTRWPIVALLSLGKNHQQQAQVVPEYVTYYNPHRAGVFLSAESFNGWTIHAGDDGLAFPAAPALNQGSVLDWIAIGGTFTVGNIQEPTACAMPNQRVLFKAFFVYGLSWGEASLASLPYLGQYQTVIGDPLATITAYDPDISGPDQVPDRKVDHYDLALLQQQYGQSGFGLEADINGDGIVNGLDRSLVYEAYGRNCSTPPIVPLDGLPSCGNINLPHPDTFVDEEDLALFDAYIASIGGYQPCPLLECWDCPCQYDFTMDGVVDEADRDVIVQNLGACLDLDVDNTGFIDLETISKRSKWPMMAVVKDDHKESHGWPMRLED